MNPRLEKREAPQTAWGFNCTTPRLRGLYLLGLCIPAILYQDCGVVAPTSQYSPGQLAASASVWGLT